VSTASTFEWLRTGEEALAAMIEAIAVARESIRLETYIYHGGPVGNKFREALVAAQQRGVQVMVMLDAFGSMGLPGGFWSPLTKAGGEFAWFNPLSLKRWSYRNHRKLLVCDNSTAFIGGFNIAEEYAGDGVQRGWRDLGLRIRGPLADELAESFDRYFARAGVRHKKLQRLRKAQTQVTTGKNWKLLLSGPGRRHGQLRRSLVRDLEKARSVKIVCAYFLPTWRLRKALMKVSRQGGRVQLSLAGKTDVKISQLAGRRLYQPFLRAGAEIYEYQPQILHTKMFLVDDVVYAGSSNLDNRSLKINYELLVRVEDARLAGEGREIFQQDLQHCAQINPDTWPKSRSFWEKLKENWAYFFLARVDTFFARLQLKRLR